MYNYLSRDVTANVGYDYILRQCRLRGKIDSNGCTTSYLEERKNLGLKLYSLCRDLPSPSRRLADGEDKIKARLVQSR
ncbi:hypothetical protein V6N11_004009 [Hibiscus sabdariffa]|uniref:Uncharacterized protein n=1 Tax=Hibiscus sabdariffa TaxID=183260 RepID=A0ABR2SFK4_9ROSI